MKIIITMAGKGQRFIDAGYTVPKYMITVNNKTLFEWSILSLSDFFDQEFIFILRDEKIDNSFFREILHSLGVKKITFLKLRKITDGQASTVIEYTNNLKINQTEDLLVYNIDTYVEKGFIKKDEMIGSDGHIYCFETEGDKWSFVKTDYQNKVIDVVEKKRVSNKASIGCYYFSSIKLFNTYYFKYKTEVKKIYKETYIAPFYRYMLNDNFIINYNLIPSNKVHVLGTPMDLNKFNEKNNL